jgi:hypothetical protein
MTRWLTAALGVSLGLFAATPAGARPPSAATLTVSFELPLAMAQPYVSSADGTFSASGALNDAGAAHVLAHFAAVPSPTVGILQSRVTLEGQAGTIDLRCNQRADDFSDPTAVPDTGNCTVVKAGGGYAGLHGTGKVEGTANIMSDSASITETIALSVH